MLEEIFDFFFFFFFLLFLLERTSEQKTLRSNYNFLNFLVFEI